MKPKRYRRILAIDIGGSHVKMRLFGRREMRQVESGPDLTPRQMVAQVHELTGDWIYDAVSIGYPGVVLHGKVVAEPHNLGKGWVGFDFRKAFGRPTHVLNDAAMQAVGSYEGGRMLFLGLGTGLGSALVTQRSIIPLELGSLRYTRKRTLHDCLGRAGLRRLGLRGWRAVLAEVVTFLKAAFQADYIMLGGGNAKKVGEPPPWSRLGSNLCAFRGGYRLWGLELTPTLTPDGRQEELPAADQEWRMI